MSNIYIKIKTTGIDPQAWESTWQEMISIIEAIPLTFLRLLYPKENQYNCEVFTTNIIDKKDAKQENLSFKGDSLSLSFGEAFLIHRNLETLKDLLPHAEVVEDKPVYWIPEEAIGDSYTIYANGNTLGQSWGIKTGLASYHYVIVAIGMLYENRFPENLFMWSNTPHEEVETVRIWLEQHFKQDFKMPICHDMEAMVDKLEEFYTPNQIMVRIDCLNRRNESLKIKTFLKHFGNKWVLSFYASKLSHTSFGTFGFYNVIEAWMNITQDLEFTLSLIAESKKILNASNASKEQIEEGEKYNLTIFLKYLLKTYILWTPQQRERLELFYTNKERLETGSENLMDILFRMRGMTIDICPIYATEQELFEAFMYHNPQEGKTYKTIIDDWIAQNKAIADEINQKIAMLEDTLINLQAQNETQKYPASDVQKLSFLTQYSKKEQFWIEKAISEDAYFVNIEEGIEDIYKDLEVFIDNPENTNFIQNVKKEKLFGQKEAIKHLLMKQKFVVTTAFYEHLEKEDNKNVIFHLHIFASLKITDDARKYYKFHLLTNNLYWDKWRI